MKLEINWVDCLKAIQDIPPLHFLSFAVAVLAVAVVLLAWKLRK